MDGKGTTIAKEIFDEKNNLHKITAKVNNKWVDIFKRNKITENTDENAVPIAANHG